MKPSVSALSPDNETRLVSGMQFSNGYGAVAADGKKVPMSRSEEMLLVSSSSTTFASQQNNPPATELHQAKSNWALLLKVFCGAFALVGLLFLCSLFHSSILAFIKRSSVYIRESGIYGVLGAALLTFIFCFPIIVGFGMLQTLIGFIYGFPAGIFISAPAMLIGATTCYALFSKKSFSHWARNKISKNEIMHSITKVFMTHPWRMTLLCRLSALPFVSMTLLNAVMHIGYAKFLVGMIVVVLKACLHVYIGACLSGVNGTGTTARMVSMVITVLANIFVGYVCLRLIRREFAPTLYFKSQSPLPLYY